jgi:stearoyl-CoA desaturase (delta-9 desaturase)
VTIFLHRHQAHRALDLHPIISHFFRFWLWMTTGQATKEWAAIHRKHHARVETAEDPHSPQVHGLKKVLLEGAELYRKEKNNQETLERYGQGTPDDWLERNVYTKHSAAGAVALLITHMTLFGFIGLSIWAIQMAWIPFFAGGVINGVGHFVGYRNFESQDASRNIIPFGIFIGGEELHNNHHTYGTSAKFSVKWWEIDLGWYVIRLLQLFGLAKPKRTPPKATLISGKSNVDIDTLKAVLTHRFQIMADYHKTVITPVFRDEGLHSKKQGRSFSKLKMVSQARLTLLNLWAKSTADQNTLLKSLQEWCKRAEESGIEALRSFVTHLKAHAPSTC